MLYEGKNILVIVNINKAIETLPDSFKRELTTFKITFIHILRSLKCACLETDKRKYSITADFRKGKDIYSIECLSHKYKKKQIHLDLKCKCGVSFKFRRVLSEKSYSELVKQTVKKVIQI